ncbi:tripartite motif-containing protein 45-like [Dreissena polymorpha]|nr:tripartite motif-containing protein 45-like [Dreissena polymorpha]
MATSAFSRNFDLVKYYCCTICEKERSVEIDAEFYCKKCRKYYCKPCIQSHRQHGWWFNKKSPYGKDKIMKWPRSKKMENYLITCDIHKDEKITILCNSHSELCCSSCVELNHSQCSKVTPINELTDMQPTDLQGLSVELETVLGEIKSLQISQELSVQALLRTYKEHGAVMIEQMRGNLNFNIDDIDECGNSYVSTSGGHEQYLKEEMCRSVLLS